MANRRLAALAEGTRRIPRFRPAITTPYLFIAPALIALVVVVLYPLFFATYLSVHNYVLTRPADRDFVGLGNFQDLLADPLLWTSMQRTAVWVVVVVVAQFALGMAIAIYLNQQFRLREVLRGIVLIPWVTPSAVIAISWLWMFDANFGVVNDILLRLGLIETFQAWYSDPNTAFPTVIVSAIWQGVPFFAIMLLAGLQTISPEVLEAAHVDGADAVQSFMRITLPLLLPTVLITALLRTIWVANHVDLIFMTTRGGPGFTTHTMAVLTLLTARAGLDYGHASALALLLGAMLVIPLTVYVIALRRQEILE